MKQYTTPEQTAKLIELGFEPSTRIPFEVGNDELGRTFSIGELIEILPQTINVFYDLSSATGFDRPVVSTINWSISILSSHKGWWVLYGLIGDGDMWSIEREIYRNELIDALYDMVIVLKRQGLMPND